MNKQQFIKISVICVFIFSLSCAYASGDWQTLFNGKNLDGWQVKRKPEDRSKTFWQVIDGCIVADSMSDSDHDYVWLQTEQEFGDFELRLRFQAYRDCRGNSGIQIRSRYDEKAFWLDGPQFDIESRNSWRTGFLYDETRGYRKWISPSLDKVNDAKPEMAAPNMVFYYSDDTPAWNDLRIFAKGTRLIAVLNGVKIRDWDGAGLLDDAIHRQYNVGMRGHIALQIHSGHRLKMRYKDITVRELNPVKKDDARGKQMLKPRISRVSRNGMPKNIVKPGSRWNFGPGSLWTHKGWQYAAYWDENCRVSVARRQLPSGPWKVASLRGYKRTSNINRGILGVKSKGFGDGHEKVSMGISSDGYIHLAFDHHGSPLHYRKSKVAVADNPAAHKWTNNLFDKVQDHLGGPSINLVTYPKFIADGDSLFLYLRLNGGSGSADSCIFEYANGRWQVNSPKRAKFIDKNWSGGNKTVNAYPHSLVVQNGRRHITWCWRDTPTPSTCHDLCYAYSDDHGKTWKNNAGQTVAQTGSSYITADTPGIEAWDIAPGGRYINGGSMTVDPEGRVHVLVRGKDGYPAYFRRDPSSGKWIRRRTTASGMLVPGNSDSLYIVSDDGLKRTSATNFLHMKTLASGNKSYFDDSSMGIDKTRPQYDGWVSVIGQKGKTVTVIDYYLSEE